MSARDKSSESPGVLASLQARLATKSAQVGVVGLGYVGLPLALLFAEAGFPTFGFDIDREKVEALNSGRSYIRHIPAAVISEAMNQRRFKATADFRKLREMDTVIVCVPTPLDDHREPDLSFIRNTAEEIKSALRPGQLVVLESTSFPGTTEEVVLPILEKSGLRCPVFVYSVEDNRVQPNSEEPECDFLLAFSPEREDPGNKHFGTRQIPKVIGGVNGQSAQAAQGLYGQAFDRTILVSSSRVAEMTKLLENIYRCVNIALVNELKMLSLRMGIDIWEVIEAAKTKPFGYSPFYPGPGLGGHCIPIDPFYLTWKAREYEFPTRFIELAGEINSGMPEFVVSSLMEALNRRKQCLKGAHLLVLGVAYKKDLDDIRESPALRIIQLLLNHGAHVQYHDPHFDKIPKLRNYSFSVESAPPTPENLAKFDAVIIVTDHSSYDYQEIARYSKVVIDTRHATKDVKEFQEKIVHC